MVPFLKRNIQLILIIFVALIVRLVLLGTIPNGFHVDEVNAGYIGRYIWTHGKDILGNYLPLTYNKFGDFRPTGIFYLSGLSALVLGSTEFAVRLPAALFGAFSVLVIYLLGYELFQNKKIALFSAAALAIMPWHIVLSRATSEGIVGLFFIIWGLGFILRGIRTNSLKSIVIGSICLTASYLFYHTFRILVPLIFLPVCFHPNRKIHIKRTLWILFGIFSLLTILTVFSVAGKGRLSQVVFYKNPDLATSTQNLIAGEGPNHVLEARIYHNKIVVYLQEFIHQYSTYYSTDFLMLKGGLPLRYSVPQEGLIYVSFFILLLTGLMTIVLSRSRWTLFYILFLFFVAPLPAAVTYEDAPNTQRAIFMILPMVLLIAYGFSKFLEKLQRRTRISVVFVIIVSIIISVETINFWHYYTVFAATNQGFYRNDGFKELVQLAWRDKGKYKYIYLPGYENLPLYYLFYASDYHNLTFRNDPNDVLLDKRDNVVFVPDWCSSRYLRWKNMLEPSTLIVDRGDCDGFHGVGKIGGIVRKDQTSAFVLLRFIPD